MTGTTAPLRVTLVDDSDLAVAGLDALLAPYADRVTIVDTRQVLADPDCLDVLLYEPLHLSSMNESLLRDLQARVSAPSAVFSWADVDQLPTATARPYLGKRLAASQLVVRLETLASGRVDPHQEYTAPAGSEPATPAPAPLRLAASHDPSVLTPREEDILALIVAGMSNREISEELGLSVNSVKTYIRTAYRKMGVARRTQAMRWALLRGIGEAVEGSDDGSEGSAVGAGGSGSAPPALVG